MADEKISEGKARMRAIGLHSGGLDSILADALIRAQGIEVRAVHFYTGLSSETREAAAREDAKLGITRELIDISGDEYLHMITHPRHGYGAHANPCIDCRIFMLRKARELMEAWGASFVFTGEVLGQRPKSQRREAMAVVERESGLEGRLVRPLSAQFLSPTIPEQEGLLDRSRLLALKGRMRTPQMELAKKLGITDYPQPAGGCWLTDETFGRRFHELMARRPERNVTQEEMRLLLTGRHFRLADNVRLVVARNEAETEALQSYADGRWLVEAVGVNGPVAVVEGEPDAEARRTISAIVARYGQGRELPEVNVEWRKGGESFRETAAPLKNEGLIAGLRV